MINVLRSEWIKLRTVRMNHVLTGIAVAFPVIVVVLTTVFVNTDDFSTRDLVGLVTGTSVITGLLLGVIGAAGITSEFGFGTIRPTFAATPRRWMVIVAKAVVTLVMALVVEAIVVVVAYGAGAAILGGRDATVDLSTAGAGALASLIGVVLFAAIVSLLGYGLGLLMRSTPAAVSVLILWPLLVENILTLLLGRIGLDHPQKWMPYSAGFSLGYPDAGVDADTLGRVMGGLYFFAVTVAITAIGAVLVQRRDA